LTIGDIAVLCGIKRKNRVLPFGKTVKTLIKCSLGLTAGALFIFLLSPLLCRAMFFDLPDRSAVFDCDDASLFMYQRMSNLGIKAVPIIGNLETTGETFTQSTHIWLMVNFGGINVALDWGSPWLDRQHYEGYMVTYNQMAQFVQQDFDSTTITPTVSSD
jgi:hypothetical protein